MDRIDRIHRGDLPSWLAHYLEDCDDEYLPTEECVETAQVYWDELVPRMAVPPDDIGPDGTGGLNLYWSPLKRNPDLYDVNISVTGKMSIRETWTSRHRQPVCNTSRLCNQ